MKIMVVSAISRESSSCYVLARQIADLCAAHDVEIDFVTPADADLPINDGTVAYDHPAAVAWADRVGQIHAHIWVSPEYHSGMTGGMKNLFDHLGKEPMKGDVVGLFALAGGNMAALNTLNNMSVVARSLGAWVAPDYCALNSNDVKDGLDEAAVARLQNVIDQVILTAGQLQPDA